MGEFSLIGIDGNAFSVIGYTARALKEAGLKDLVEQMRRDAMSDDYYHLLDVCERYIEMTNEAMRENQ